MIFTTELIAVCGQIFTLIFGSSGEGGTTGFVGYVSQNPILLLPVGIGLVGAVAGLFRRMTRIGGRSRR